jgi:hypothetical protein
MNKNRFTISSITAGIAVVLLLITVGTGATTTIFLLNTAYAQSATLGEPFFKENGKTTAQGEIGPNRTQYSYTANGTMNGNIEVTNTGDFVSVSKGNNLTFDQGQGVIKTKDGSETANYTFIEVFNGTAYQGASAHSTNSTGKLSFLNNILGIFKGGVDESGNFVLEQWHWK